MLFYLINNITVGTTFLWAGSPVDDSVEDADAMRDAGGVLIPSTNAAVAAAALDAQAIRSRGGSPAEAAGVMQGALGYGLEFTPGPGAALADADATIDVSGGRWRVLPAGTLGANRALTVDDANAQLGDELLVTRVDVEAFTYTIDNGGPGAGTLVVLPASLQGFARLWFNGTDWVLKEAGTVG